MADLILNRLAARAAFRKRLQSAARTAVLRRELAQARAAPPIVNVQAQLPAAPAPDVHIRNEVAPALTNVTVDTLPLADALGVLAGNQLEQGDRLAALTMVIERLANAVLRLLSLPAPQVAVHVAPTPVQVNVEAPIIQVPPMPLPPPRPPFAFRLETNASGQRRIVPELPPGSPPSPQ